MEKGGFIVECFRWKPINKIDCSFKCISPICERKRSLGQKGKPNLYYVIVFIFFFDESVLLMCMWARETMVNSKFLTHGGDGFEFTTSHQFVELLTWC